MSTGAEGRGLTPADWAAHLVRLSKNVRAAGDMKQVWLADDGVSEVDMTLADELFVVALNLDYDAAMSANKEGDRG